MPPTDIPRAAPSESPGLFGAAGRSVNGKSRILVVEDEAIVALDLAHQLSDMGYEVLGPVASGKAALQLVHERMPHLVLMDIVIQGDQDGIQTAEQMSRLHIPVVFLTAYSDPGMVERAARTASYGYLTKPYQPRELRASIEVALYKSRVERGLRESEQWYAATLRCVADGVIATDHQGAVRFMNPPAEALTGWPAAEAAGRPIEDVVKLRDAKSGRDLPSPVRRALCEQAVSEGAFGALLQNRDGNQRPVDESAAPIRNDEGQLLGAVLAVRDVEERIKVERQLRESEGRFRTAFDFAPLGMALVSLDGRLLQVNKALGDVLATPPDSLIDQNQRALTCEEDRSHEQALLNQMLGGEYLQVQFEKRYRRPNGQHVWVLVSASLLQRDGVPFCYLYQVHDLTERKSSERQLARLAYYDTLTGLYNRAGLGHEAERLLSAARSENRPFAMMFLDLDDFKKVNDTLGHEAGDLLLQGVAERLRQVSRTNDCLARIGGDEFVLIMPGVGTAKLVIAIADKIRSAMAEPIDLAGHSVVIGVSMGASFFPQDGEDTGTLLRCADSALYHAKAEGRNGLELYRREMSMAVAERFEIERDLRHALRESELEVHYQPIVALSTRDVVGAEALVRWRHPHRGLVMPDRFIRVAEASGMIVELGRMVLNRACSDAAGWTAINGVKPTVSVNLSAGQFRSSALVEMVRVALDKSGLQPDRLCLEITERLMLRDSERNLTLLAQLRALGVRIAVDDFGTGYSSLQYLHRFAPHTMKIDASFVRDVTTSTDNAAIVRAVIAMGHNLGLLVVAEGVETEVQHDFLLREGCDLGQGWLYGYAGPAENLQRRSKLR